MEFKMNMLIPFDQDGLPVVPSEIFTWIRRIRKKRIVIDLGADIKFEVYNDAIYLKTFNSSGREHEFLRYVVNEDKLYYWNDGDPIVIDTVEYLKQCYLTHYEKYGFKPAFEIEDFTK